MPWRKRFVLEFVAAMCLYAGLLVASLTTQVAWQPAGPMRFALALVPMVGCVTVMIAIMRGIRQMDELERRVQFEALAFAFAATALATFGWGFVENVGAPKLPTFGVWPIMGAFWFAGTFAASRRYR